MSHRATGILLLSSGKVDFPKTNVMYHRDCRSDFTHKREVNQTANVPPHNHNS